MDNIKLDWKPTKIIRLNKKIIPTLVLVLQCLSPILSFEKAAL